MVPSIKKIQYSKIDKRLSLERRYETVCAKLSTEGYHIRNPTGRFRLSEKNRYRLKVRCPEGHKPFFMSIYDLERGHRCKFCREFWGERATRLAFERIFKASFDKQRPSWLRKSPNDIPLELDGFNDRLRIAFEHQGRQHFTTVRGNAEILAATQKRDQFKKDCCAAEGVALFQIREVSPLTLNTLRPQIIEEANRLGLRLPSSIRHLNLSVSDIPLIPREKDRVLRITKIVEERSFSMMKDSYSGYLASLKLLCAKGHEHSVQARTILQGLWKGRCSKCLAGPPPSKEELAEVLRSKRLRLLNSPPQHGREVCEWGCVTCKSKISKSWLSVTKSKIACSKCNAFLPKARRALVARGLNLESWSRHKDCLSIHCTACDKEFKRNTSFLRGPRRCPFCALTQAYIDLATRKNVELAGPIPKSKKQRTKWKCLTCEKCQRLSFTALKARVRQCDYCFALPNRMRQKIENEKLPFVILSHRKNRFTLECTIHKRRFSLLYRNKIGAKCCADCKEGALKRSREEYCNVIYRAHGWKILGPLPSSVTSMAKWLCPKGHHVDRQTNLLREGHTECKECQQEASISERRSRIEAVLATTRLRLVRELTRDKYLLRCQDCREEVTRWRSNIHHEVHCPNCPNLEK
jgi:hypothetical protein